jgi:hypothetical protein
MGEGEGKGVPGSAESSAKAAYEVMLARTCGSVEAAHVWEKQPQSVRDDWMFAVWVAVAEEREACARLVEVGDYIPTVLGIAAAIRARGG